MLTSSSKATRPALAVWCADNEAYTGRFEWQRYATWLAAMRPYQDSCVFVSCPDVVGDAQTTLDLFAEYAPQIRALGYPVALVGQDGLELLSFPQVYDALFVGGGTDWKLSEGAAWCIRRAQQAGKWVHVGRVNSQKRIRHFALLDVDSVDGTTIAFEPDHAYRLLAAQLRQPPLFTLR